MLKIVIRVAAICLPLLLLCCCSMKQADAEVLAEARSLEGSGQVLLTWESAENAAGYAVFRSYEKDGTYDLVETLDGNKNCRFLDQKQNVGKTCYYKICCIADMQSEPECSAALQPLEVRILEEIGQDPEDPLMLVNKNCWLSRTYVPTDLVSVGEFATAEMTAKGIVRSAYEKLYRAAGKQGLDIRIVSAYRDYALQKQLFAYWCKVDGKKQALRTSAKAGRSEHQTGYALDVSCASEGWDLQESFGLTPEGQWLADHCWKYGFIIRYKGETEAVTGYAYEPWHIRYVGEAAAKEIYEQNVTLEEYLGY
ncbi:D-alanyl-D-alanine carboxypeptidase family protein [Ihubacter sp. mB4P-1]|uniref:M15 family metallopeptidase n=1 Tax=Ihubacter sp. mB4P-1 TaxID=3242370 RepID=UPI003C7C07FD